MKLLLSVSLSVLVSTSVSLGIDYHNLPIKPVFPGPWDKYIKAPANKSFITPARFWKVDGNVTKPSNSREPLIARHSYGGDILIGEGGLLTVEFQENIAGR